MPPNFAMSGRSCEKSETNSFSTENESVYRCPLTVRYPARTGHNSPLFQARLWKLRAQPPKFCDKYLGG